MKKTAVVIFNLGGPSSPEEIKPFLFNLFYDPAILTIPNPFRYLLAKVISHKRFKKTKEIYSFLGGRSPLLKNTQTQALALERELGSAYKVFVAMRYASPLIEEVWRKVETFSPREIVLLPLYPQFSTTTTGSSLKEWKKASKGKSLPTYAIPFYPAEKGFLCALKERIKFHYEKARKAGHPKILLTAHGLPEKLIKKGDPYQKQVEETVSSLVNILGITNLDYVLCYQSRVGPLKWTEPSLEEQVLKASQEKRPLVVVPISFVSEHSETLVELDILYRNKACENGCPSYHRVETVQTHPLFIKGLANLITCAQENSHAL